MIRKLQARLAALRKDMDAISAKAIGADGVVRELSAEEQTAFDALKAEMGATEKALDRALDTAAQDRDAAVTVAIAGNGADRTPRVDLGQDRRELDAKGGFKAFGEFARSVVSASIGERIDPRLRSLEGGVQAGAPTTFGSEAVATDGGFMVPPEFSSEIFTLALTDDALLPLTDGVPLSGNSMVFPKDETTPWGTDGVRAYWQAEASVATQTKPKIGTTMLRLHKMMALVPLTDELVADAPALGGYITPLIARSIRWKTNEALLFGTGAGQPLGMFTGAGVANSPAVVQAKDSGQATLTLTIGNVTNMIARLAPGSGPSFWLITPDALPLLYQMTLGNYPIFLPMNQGIRADVNAGGAFGGGPEGMLLGRPLYKSQHAAAFTSQGDLLLLAPQWYRSVTKAGEGINMASSLHLYFDADAVAFRATFRVDGQPKLLNPISQAKGSKTLSPFIALQAR